MYITGSWLSLWIMPKNRVGIIKITSTFGYNKTTLLGNVMWLTLSAFTTFCRSWGCTKASLVEIRDLWGHRHKDKFCFTRVIKISFPSLSFLARNVMVPPEDCSFQKRKKKGCARKPTTLACYLRLEHSKAFEAHCWLIPFKYTKAPFFHFCHAYQHIF